MSLNIGDLAPDFELKDQDKNPWRLSEHRGRKVVVVFYPFAFSGVCQAELCQIRDEYRQYEEEGAIVVGVSTDTPHALKAWREQQGFNFPLLSDRWPLGEVAKAYGAFNDSVGAANRLTVIVDTEGKIAATFSSPDLGTPRDADYGKALRDAS